MLKSLSDPHNRDLVMKFGRQLLPFVGGLAVGAGLVTKEQVAYLLANYDGILEAVGAAIAALSALWMFVNNTRKAQIQKVDAMPEVAKVVVKDAAADLASSIPSPTVLTASDDKGPSGTGGLY
jgi:enamine deaminase RidA (YjgF/YER057c/UK114 family)